ncbi:hypothetical protein [Isoptericola sp. NPDC019482]|uniref:hypothetical protein n=1 Tax=Isoptericola sp. NPDC019482 TaxID=3154688 RepID=UPI0034730631
MTTEPPLSDDELGARLRRATADVPPSTLDLDAVLRASRRSAARHRAVVGGGCVAALAVVGVGLPAAPGLWQSVPHGGTAPAGVGTVAGCQPSDVDVTWRSEAVEPIVLWLDRESRTGQKSAVDRLVEVDGAAAAPHVSVERPRFREGILRAAERDATNPPPDGERVDERTETVFSSGSGSGSGAARSGDLLEGFAAARAGAVDATNPFEERATEGTTLHLATGREHLLEGTADCAGEEVAFVLSYWEADGDPRAVPCEEPADDGIDVLAKREYCPGDLSAAERDVVGLDGSDASVRTLETLARQLRLAAAG